MRRLTDQEADMLCAGLVSINFDDPEDQGCLTPEEIRIWELLVRRGLATQHRHTWEDDESEWECDYWQTTALGRLALRLYESTKLFGV